MRINKIVLEIPVALGLALSRNKGSDVVKKPYTNNENLKHYKRPANLNGIKYQTFCGT